jgi:hypothetical protein
MEAAQRATVDALLGKRLGFPFKPRNTAFTFRFSNVTSQTTILQHSKHGTS